MVKKYYKKNQKKLTSAIKFPSELRFDPMGKDWVVVATGRAKRPETLRWTEKTEVESQKATCPFCHLETQEVPVLVFSHGRKILNLRSVGDIPDDWTTVVIPNKFPAFLPSNSLEEEKVGPYKIMKAVGFHEVVITKDHKKHIARLSVTEIKELIDAYHLRYKTLMQRRLVNYISIFCNHGLRAGASIGHPHSQIVAIPLIDSDLRKALSNARKYYKKHKKCIYCVGNQWESRERERIVYENKEFLAICPFASKIAFEVIITPKKHSPYFDRITEEQKIYLAKAFKAVFSKLDKGLNNPPYNFYLHSAPCDGKNYDFYHWHWTILPKTTVPAGFELGARIEISTIEPEKAAAYLRKQ